MKNIVKFATVAALVMGVTTSFAGDMALKVTKTIIPEGCEYKKIPGHKKKQLVCEEELAGGGGVVGVETGVDVSGMNVEMNGNSNVQKGANNGKGNGSDDGTNPPGGSSKKFASRSTDNR